MMLQISSQDFQLRAELHKEKISPLADAFIKRRGVGISHPVHDFLFIYYNFSPAKLKQWNPSIDEQVLVNEKILQECSWLNDHWYSIENNLLTLNREMISKSTIKAALFIENLCDHIVNRPARLNCFGLHEWAMVYKASAEAIRHKGYKLRLPQDELDAFVQSEFICCSHYDAYRFFTDEARPLNRLNPVLETRLEMEQGGCLHANMDIYKWATRLYPWIGADFISKAFFIALEGRELDMRASPYDLTDEGFLPICIETRSGKEQYKEEQKQLMERAMPLRKELSAFCKRLRSIA